METADMRQARELQRTYEDGYQRGRREQYEEDCAKLCGGCAEKIPVVELPDDFWTHGTCYCSASALRAAHAKVGEAAGKEK